MACPGVGERSAVGGAARLDEPIVDGRGDIAEARQDLDGPAPERLIVHVPTAAVDRDHERVRARRRRPRDVEPQLLPVHRRVVDVGGELDSAVGPPVARSTEASPTPASGGGGIGSASHPGTSRNANDTTPPRMRTETGYRARPAAIPYAS
jgi:hypothetical protein